MDKMKYLGSAVLLYFYFVKICIMITAFVLMFYGIYACSTNFFGEGARK
jgi:hypothetical protein